MKCKECGGELNLTKSVELPLSIQGRGTVYACEVCGRLHWYQNGTGVYNGKGKELYLHYGKVSYKGILSVWTPQE